MVSPDTRPIWYRYWDYCGSNNEPVVVLQEVRVLKETEKGVWLETDWEIKNKFVLKEARKRWAYPTIELARDSFEKRKLKQLQHVKNKMDYMLALIEAIENGTVYDKKEFKFGNGLEGFSL